MAAVVKKIQKIKIMNIFEILKKINLKNIQRNSKAK